MVGLRPGSLSSSRLIGDVSAESGFKRSDFSKPQSLTADQLLSSGPKGGPGSPQDRRHKRILKNQAILMDAARSVVEDPAKLRKAMSTQDLRDVPKKTMIDSRGQLGAVVLDRVQQGFLETTLCHPRSQMRKDRLKDLRGKCGWAESYKGHVTSTTAGTLAFLSKGADSLEAIQRAQVLKAEARAAASAGETQELSSIGASADRNSRPLRQPSEKDLRDLPPGYVVRDADVIVRDAMDMLQKWKQHEEVAIALCDCLVTMAEACGDEYAEEMGRRGIAVLASTVVDIWSHKPDVVSISLRLLGLASVELLIATLTENLASALMTMTGLEALNKLAKEGQEGLDDIARYGGRELLDDVDGQWGDKDRLIHLHALNLRRRLKKSKVKSLFPRLQVALPPEDIVRIRGCFEAVDADGSGEIGEEELGVAFRMMGMKLDPDELHKEFCEVDLDGSGSVEWPEFLFLMSKFGAGESLESKFTEERLTELREVFSLFDDDGNGSLDATELGLVLRSVGLVPTDREIQTMIDDVDADGSGCIEWPEFLFLMSKNVVKPDEQHKFAFEFFDKAGEGRIQKHDFVRQMRSLSNDFSESELEEMFAEAKFENGDAEQLTYKEFVKMMMR
eukprot:TRINITY_DN48266_c0_g1_i1.p1 TRINITY_DN48266_c0_g1~~TRINITY_DN48266_c0_g1_i1.p1  ORF type:complete len:619 (+),score=149.78 TRINITY_DN48266_c0_g1_i1:85-1941(+)